MRGHLASSLTIAGLVVLLVLVTGAAKRAVDAKDRLDGWCAEQMKTDLRIIDTLKQANRELIDRLEATR